MKILTSALLLSLLIAGVIVISALTYSSYHSMEQEMSVTSAASPGHAVTSEVPPTTREPRLAATPSASPVPAIGEQASTAAQALPLSTSGASAAGSPAMEEVIVEEVPPPPPAVPIPGAFAMAKMTNVPGVDQERLAGIAQDFSDKVKAAGWDTTSPAYHQAWKQAAEESEEVLKSAIGVQAWQELKMRQSQED